jgi:hypothetical protein
LYQGQSHAAVKGTFIPQSFIGLETAGKLDWQEQDILFNFGPIIDHILSFFLFSTFSLASPRMSPSNAESKNAVALDQHSINNGKHTSEDSGEGPTEKELSSGAVDNVQYTAATENLEIASRTIEDLSSEQEEPDSWLEGWRLQVVNLS